MTQTSPATLAVDLMGSDHGPEVLLRGVHAFLVDHPNARVALAGRPAVLDAARDAWPADWRQRVTPIPAAHEIDMGASARDALRAPADTSMRLALEAVRDGRADAAVSAGNTGALMALALKSLTTLEAVRRPAIVSAIPAIGGHTFMLDLGANADCSASQLVEFAVMGECVARQAAGLKQPRVGLLNIGQEASKGTPTIREAAKLLRATPLDFVGFVEGHDIFSGSVDVVVSDGFTGNVALKTMEGLAGLVRHTLAASGAGDTHSQALETLDPRRRNGATLVGLNRVVVKSHGNADEVAFAHALGMAWTECRGDVPAAIARRFAELARNG